MRHNVFYRSQELMWLLITYLVIFVLRIGSMGLSAPYDD